MDGLNAMFGGPVTGAPPPAAADIELVEEVA
jgi:hypothetical protein